MIEINERKEVLKKLKPLEIVLTSEQIKKNFEFAERTKRESNYKAGMSEISAGECYVFSKN